MRKYILGFVFLSIFIISGVATFLLLHRLSPPRQKVTGSPEITKEPTLSQTKVPEGISYNYLLLGYGGAGHDGGNLSDVIIILHVDPARKVISQISIPRDLWVEIPIRSDIKQNFKVNAAYAIGTDDRKYPLKEPQYKGGSGGGIMAKKVISDVTGLNIQKYIAVDFESFKKIINTLGGIDVNVSVAFDDYSYPIKGLENETCGFGADKIAQLHQQFSGFDLEKQFTCRYEHLHFDKGVQKMDGETTLKFVRSRHSSQDGGDFARSRRQKEVLLAMKDKLISLYAVKKADELYNEFKGFITSDFDVSSVKTLAQVFGSPKDYKVNFISLNENNVLVATKSLDGQFILIPKEGENVWRGVQKYIYEEIAK